MNLGDVLPDGTIQCAWHGARFDCRTGAPLSPPAEEPVERYTVDVHDGMIFVHEGTT